MITITLDTSVFVEEEKPRVVEARLLCERLHGSLLDVAISTRLTADKENDPDLERRTRHFKRLSSYAEQPPAPFRLDCSELGVDILSGDASDGDIIQDLEAIFTRGVTSPRRRAHSTFDADHVWAHWAAGREYFVTSDQQALKAIRAELFARFGIKVIEPEELLSAHESAILSPDQLATALANNLQRAHRESVGR